MELSWKGAIIGMITLVLKMVCCKEEDLLDVPKNKVWSWTPLSKSKWSQQQVKGKRVYSVCDVSSSPKPSNWLPSDPIALNGAKAIDVNIEFTVRRCASLSGAKPYCNHGFSLYQITTNIINSQHPSPPNGYRKISNVVGTNLHDGSSSDVPTNTETVKVKINDTGTNVLLAFLDQGACLSLLSVRVSYNYCPSTTLTPHLITLPTTVSPYVTSNSTKVNGNCVVNSTERDGSDVFALCQSNGEWNTSNMCICKEGFTHKGETCEACPKGTYKSDVGNEECIQCPSYSTENKNRTICECQVNYHRAPGEDHTKACSTAGQPNVTVRRLNRTSAIIEWSFKDGYEAVDLFITYYKKDDSLKRQNITAKASRRDLVINNLEPNAAYIFEIQPKNMLGLKPKTITLGTMEGTTISTTGTSGSRKMTIYIIVGAVSGALVLMVILIVLLIHLRRRNARRRPGYGKPQGTEMFSRGLYIDPNNYADPLELLKNFASEIERGDVTIDTVIGGGEFGDVYKGELKGSCGSSTVAVKILKQGSSPKNRDDFIFEASIMGQFDHVNVIHLEGVVTKTLPMMIITELMENGSLESFLKSRNKQLSHLQLIGMARGVASGMTYLAGMNFIHRDLAARNILVGENMACKVADFGLSRELDDDPESEYQTQGGKIAIRWTATEALRYRIFSSASDVWSYGIVLWEIMSFAERPYWDWDNFKVMDRVQAGFRLSAPLDCPKIIHDIMMACWEDDKNNRPKFAELLKKLDELIRSPETLKGIYSQANGNATTDFANLESVHDWLDSINMKQYASLFVHAGYQDLQQVSVLGEAEIFNLGVKLAGHRNKITKSIKAMKTHFSNSALEAD